MKGERGEHGYTSLDDAPVPQPPVSNEGGSRCPVCDASLSPVRTTNGCTVYHCECCHYVWADAPADL